MSTFSVCQAPRAPAPLFVFIFRFTSALQAHLMPHSQQPSRLCPDTQVISSHLTISLPISHVHSIGAKIYCYRRPARQFKSVSVSSSNWAVPTDSILLPLSFMPTTVVTTSVSHRSPDLLPECTDAVAGVTQ